MITRLPERLPLHCIAVALCVGLASANVARLRGAGPTIACAALLALAAVARSAPRRLGLACGAALVAGLSWGSLRLDALDRSPLRTELGRAGQAVVELTDTPRRGRFSLRIAARMLRFGQWRVREPILLELPLGRAPPRGARLRVLGVIRAPRPAEHGFDEEAFLRHRGVHVILRGDRWRLLGRRGGVGGVADRLHGGLTAALAAGTTGERRTLLVGIVAGDDSGVSEGLRDRFRASGLYHLLTLEQKALTR